MSDVAKLLDLEKEITELEKRKTLLVSDIENKTREFEEKCLKREREIDQKFENEKQNLLAIKTYNDGLLEEKTREISRLNEDLEKRKQEANLATIEIERLESVKKEITALKQSLAEKEADLSQRSDWLAEEKKSFDKRVEELNNQYETKMKYLSVKEAELISAMGELSKVELEREKLEKEKKDFDLHVEQKQKSLDTLHAECTEKIRQAEATKTEYEKLSAEVEKKNKK